jgi:hypothetical protein
MNTEPFVITMDQVAKQARSIAATPPRIFESVEAATAEFHEAEVELWNAATRLWQAQVNKAALNVIKNAVDDAILAVTQRDA